MKPLKMEDKLHKTKVEKEKYRKNIPFILHTQTIEKTRHSEPDSMTIKTGNRVKS